MLSFSYQAPSREWPCCGLQTPKTLLKAEKLEATSGDEGLKDGGCLNATWKPLDLLAYSTRCLLGALISGTTPSCEVAEEGLLVTPTVKPPAQHSRVFVSSLDQFILSPMEEQT